MNFTHFFSVPFFHSLTFKGVGISLENKVFQKYFCSIIFKQNSTTEVTIKHLNVHTNVKIEQRLYLISIIRQKVDHSML